ncbi:cis-prenyltransferase [Gurleya vavrai]
MDGNRRHAKKKLLSDKQSKSAGFEKMIEIATACKKNKIDEVSFFAFSMANFQRSSKEIDNINNLIIENKNKLCSFNEIKPKVKFYGNLGMCRLEVQEVFAEIEQKTIDHEDLIVNIFFAYSSKYEILNNEIKYNQKIDLLIRTSGQRRFSDFLLSQCSDGSIVSFCGENWPKISVLRLYFLIFKANLERKYLY